MVFGIINNKDMFGVNFGNHLVSFCRFILNVTNAFACLVCCTINSLLRSGSISVSLCLIADQMFSLNLFSMAIKFTKSCTASLSSSSDSFDFYGNLCSCYFLQHLLLFQFVQQLLQCIFKNCLHCLVLFH